MFVNSIESASGSYGRRIEEYVELLSASMDNDNEHSRDFQVELLQSKYYELLVSVCTIRIFDDG